MHATLPLGVFFSQIMVPTWTSYLLMNTGFQLVSLAVRTEEQLFWLGNAVMCLAAPYPPWSKRWKTETAWSALSIILGLFMAGSAIWYDTTRVLECGDRKEELEYALTSLRIALLPTLFSLLFVITTKTFFVIFFFNEGQLRQPFLRSIQAYRRDLHLRREERSRQEEEEAPTGAGPTAAAGKQ